MEQDERKQIWNAALADIQLQMPRNAYDQWLRGTELVAVEDTTYTISTFSPFAVQWLENRLNRIIRRALEHQVGNGIDLRFTVRSPATSDDAPALLGGPPTASEPEQESSPPPTPPPAPSMFSSATQERYSFDTFIVGPSNRLAHAAALAVAERPAMAYNPLFIYGGVGLGKTHLLLAIKSEVEMQGLSAVYVSSERFTNELITDIRSQNTQAFRARYRGADVLLVDDIQFLAGKESTQDEFFHTFNSLHAAGKQIVMSSDRPPKAIMLLEERLRSRFEGGLVADVAPPDLETRMAILQAKAETQTIRVPSEIIELVAQRVQSNIRELEGALIRIVAYAQLNGRPLDVELTEKVLRDVLDRPQSIDLPVIIETTADFYSLSLDDLESPSRRKPIAFARQIAMYLAREETDASLAEIGELLGGRDHSTVLYGVDKITELVETDDKVRREVIQIRERLYDTE